MPLWRCGQRPSTCAANCKRRPNLPSAKRRVDLVRALLLTQLNIVSTAPAGDGRNRKIAAPGNCWVVTESRARTPLTRAHSRGNHSSNTGRERCAHRRDWGRESKPAPSSAGSLPAPLRSSVPRTNDVASGSARDGRWRGRNRDRAR